MSFRGGRPPQHYGGNYRGSGPKYQDDYGREGGGYQGSRGGGYQDRGSYTPRGSSRQQAPGPPDPPDRYESPDSKGSPYKRAPGPPDPPRRNQFGEPIDSDGGAGQESQGGYQGGAASSGRGTFRPYQHRGRGSYHGDQQESSGYHDNSDKESPAGSSSYEYRGRGRGGYYDRGRGGGSSYQGWKGDSPSRGYNKEEGYDRGRGHYRGGYRGDYHQGDKHYQSNDGQGRGYFRGRGDYRGRGGSYDRGNQFGRGRGFSPRGRGAFESGGWGEPVRRSVSLPEQSSASGPPLPTAKRPRSPSLSEDSDENIPKAYRLRRRSPSSSPVALRSLSPKPKKVSVVRRSFTPSPSPEPPAQRFPVGPPHPGAISVGDGPSTNKETYPPPSSYVAKPHYEGHTDRGSFRGGRSRPTTWRGRGRGGSFGGHWSGGDQEDTGQTGQEGGESERGGFRGRVRGWVSRGRGFFDRGRGGFRGGWVDRGRGGWVDRGRGFRGRGWVDRGRGNWVDRGRGRGWVDRGRGNWVDRGRGGWVDRGRGGWVDRGRGGWVDRGRGGWVDRGRGRGSSWDTSSSSGIGGSGEGGGTGFSGGAGEEKKDSDFDMGPGWVWDDKNSCWKRKWVNKDQEHPPMPGEWKSSAEKPPMEDSSHPAVNATGDVDYRDVDYRQYDTDSRRPEERCEGSRREGGGEKSWGEDRGGDSNYGSGWDQGAEGGEWEEDGWVWDEKEQAWRTQREDGSWEWEWDVEQETEGRKQDTDQRGEYETEDQGEWVWDEGQEAWKRPRQDGSWEWEWEYQEEEQREGQGQSGGTPDPRARQPHQEEEAEPRRVGGDWGEPHPPVTQRSSSLEGRSQEWDRPPEEENRPQRQERAPEFRDYEYDQNDDYEREMNAKHDKAKKALAKYQKATRQSEALANKIEKHRRRLEEIESKLKKHRTKKRKGGEDETLSGGGGAPHLQLHPAETRREQPHMEEAQFSPEFNSDSDGEFGESSRSRRMKKHRHEKTAGKRPRSDSESVSPVSHKRQKSAVTQFLDMAEGNFGEDEEEGPSSHPSWVRCNPADPFFQRDKQTQNIISTNKMIELEDRFEHEVVLRGAYAREAKPKFEKPVYPPAQPVKEESDSEYSSSDEMEDELRMWMEKEMDRKKTHPERLHPELWFNEAGESNTGTMCRCSAKARQFGIRHNIYQGDKSYPLCETDSNNLSKLFHYRINVSPVTNFLIRTPTVIEYDSHEYIFEGFSLFSHYKIGENVPVCKVVRFNIEYTLHWIEEEPPEMFDIRSLDQFSDFLFEEILELYDMNLRDDNLGCRKYHLMPRFARSLPDNGKEILSMNQVLMYLLRSAKPLVKESDLSALVDYPLHDWNNFVDTVRGSIATYPGKRPSSIRIDQLDKFNLTKENLEFPKIIHFGMRPSQISYVGNPNYNKMWKQYVKFRHLLAYKPRVSSDDKEKLKNKEEQLQNLRLKGTMKREVTAELSCQGFIKTGISADVCQHALMIPVLISHLRFHKSLDHLEEKIRYSFKDRLLLQYAMTHPSYRYGTVNYGTNPDHARNSMFNCGIRQPQFGNRQDWIRVHRKRGIHVLIRIMAKMAKKEESVSLIDNYERLEFLGDSVVEFITTTHLYFMFPGVEEGVLATFRSAIVQNQHLTELARQLNLQDYFLYSHGVDLCHESELRRAMANCFEALMGALFVDGGIALGDRIFSEAFFHEEPALLDIWTKLPIHPLQEDEPHGDRHWIEKSPILESLLEFEELTGIQFNHIRLLARAFTLRNVGYTALTLGHNQRLEFLGDTVLQLVVSEYVFKFFPEHHEGHLSLLRQCLVNNKTQAIVCENLGMEKYMISTSQRKKQDMVNIKTKEKADLIEAYMAALYVDKGLEWARVFTQVCFFPRLQEFIVLGDWNDPKSRLQQCCLLLRNPNDQEPEMPKYKVVQARGPTNTRVYKVAVYFKGKRLADAEGQSIQQAQMNAAKSAMEKKEKLFPFLSYHKSYLETKFKEINDDIIKKMMKQEGAGSTRKKRRRPDRQKRQDNLAAAVGSLPSPQVTVKREKADENVGEKSTEAVAKPTKSKRKRRKGGNAKSKASGEIPATT